jgi:hypothetical protein
MAKNIHDVLQSIKDISVSDIARPYVYLCVHKETQQFYIGYRYKNTVPSNIDFPLYKTSSKSVRTSFDQFDWVILAEFLDKNSAYDFEQQLIYEHLADPLILNRQCHHGKQRWNFSRTGIKESDETRLKKSIARRGELNPMYGKDRSGANSTFLGKHHSEETKARISKANSGRKASEETKAKLREAAKHKPPQSKETIEKRRQHHIGAKRSEETKLKLSMMAKQRAKVQCEHCLKQISSSNYTRWHGKNCKEIYG